MEMMKANEWTRETWRRINLKERQNVRRNSWLFTGRQRYYFFLKLYNQNDDEAVIKAVQRIIAVKWTDDDHKEKFRNDWDCTMDTLPHRLDERTARSAFVRQLRKSRDMKTDIDRWLNWGKKDDRKTY